MQIAWQTLRSVRASWAPPPELTTSQFADAEIVLTSGPLAGTRWRTDFAAYQRGIMDAHHEVGVQFIIVRGSSQWGKTSIAVNVVGYHIAHDPCWMLLVEPTVKPMAEDFAKNRLDPTIRASPILAAAVDKKRQKDASNTSMMKTFKGGGLALSGANSAASLAARAVRVLILDEVDRYPPELPGEGATLSVAIKRTSAFRTRRRVWMFSSPTLVGAPIDAWYQRGDQRKYFVPCPACGVFFSYAWKDIRWTDRDPSTARIYCPSCDHGLDDDQRVAVLIHGEWRPTHSGMLAAAAGEEPPPEVQPRDPRVVSFAMWEAFSPLSSLSEIVSNFLAARQKQKEGDPAEMHTWQNTTLGEPREVDLGDGIKASGLIERCETFDDVDCPANAVYVTLGIDTQDESLEVLAVAWGPGEESWIIDRHSFVGNTEEPEPWAELEKLLDHDYLHVSGQRLPIQAACIDSAGHRTTLVYDFALKHQARQVYAIIGRDGPRPIVSSPSPRKWGRQQRQVPLYTIGVDAAKRLAVGRLNLTEKGRGYVHLPNGRDWCDEELAAQLTSERLVKQWHKGVPVEAWIKTRTRNHALDCFIYALAALRLRHPDLQVMRDRVNAVMVQGPPPAPAPKKPAWLPQRQGGWFKR